MRLALLLTSAIVLAAPAHADALLDQVIAGARAAAPVAFERTTTAEATDGKQTQSSRRVERFDPRQPEGRRWTLVSVNGAPPSAKDAEGFAKTMHAAPGPGYYRIATFLAAGARRVGEANGRVTYRVASLPKGSVATGPFDLSSYLSAEAVVDNSGPRPVVSRVRIFLPKPTRIMLVAKLDRFEAVSDYTPAAPAPVLTAQTTEVSGSNPMQGSGTQRSTISYRLL